MDKRYRAIEIKYPGYKIYGIFDRQEMEYLPDKEFNDFVWFWNKEKAERQAERLNLGLPMNEEPQGA